MSHTTLLFIAIAVYILAIVMFLYFVKSKATKRSQMRTVILQKQASLFGNAVSIPVRYSSHKHFRNICKFFVWEASGVLFLDKETAVFVSENENNPHLIFDLNSTRSYLNWVGMKLWPNGLIYWFSITINGEMHYFTSETGGFVFTSKKTTEDIYNKLREYADQIKRA